MHEYWNNEILVLGCGNKLFGDDGFGPAVVNYLLHHFRIPPTVEVIDASSAVRIVLFNLMLAEKRPRLIILVDTMDTGQKPGELFEFPVERFAPHPDVDFSFHQLPTLNLLRELRDRCGVEILLLCIQPEFLPDEVNPGMSKVVQDAVPVASRKIYQRIVSFSK